MTRDEADLTWTNLMQMGTFSQIMRYGDDYTVRYYDKGEMVEAQDRAEFEQWYDAQLRAIFSRRDSQS